MRISRRPTIAIVALILCVGCHASIPPGPVPCPTVPQLRLPDVQAQIATYIDSGGDADVAGVVDTAAPAGAPGRRRARSSRRHRSRRDVASNWAAYRTARILARTIWSTARGIRGR
jgi:hypothetical protein